MPKSSNRDIPPDATKHLGRDSALKPLKAKLVNMDGVLDHNLKELVIPLEDKEQTVGRGQYNSVCVQHKKVSRRHLRIFPDTDRWVVEDLGSVNGILVNGEKKPYARLNPGDIVKFGSLSFRFEVEGSSASTAGADIGAELLGESTDSLISIYRNTAPDQRTGDRPKTDGPQTRTRGSFWSRLNEQRTILILVLIIAMLLAGIVGLLLFNN